MEQNLRERLSSFKETIKRYKEFQINPINSEIEKIKTLYTDIGHMPVGGCCFDIVMNTLFDHLIEEKLI